MPENRTEGLKKAKRTSWRQSQRSEQNKDAREGSTPEGAGFGKQKIDLESRRFRNNEEVEMSVCEWLPNFHRDGIFKLLPSWADYFAMQ